MPYTPNNEDVFSAAQSGAVAGNFTGSPITSISPAVYAPQAAAAFEFAIEFDTQWGDTAINELIVFNIFQQCAAYWYNRPIADDVPEGYSAVVAAIIALVTENNDTSISGGVTPRPWPPTAPASITPLVRTLFVDGGYTGGSSNGSIAAPYTTISTALNHITATPVVSVNDADTVWQVWVAAAVNGYTENPVLPPCRNIYIQAIPQDSLNSLGVNITGNMTLANNGTGLEFPPGFAFYALTGIGLSGNVTITDDNTIDSGLELLGGTEVNEIIGTGASKFVFCELDQESAANGFDAPATSLTINGASGVTSNITCTFLELFEGSSIASGTVICSDGYTSNFGCTVDDITLTSPSFQSTDCNLVDITATIAATLILSKSQSSSCTFHCVNATITGTGFGGTSKILASTSVTTDAQSWALYLGQGGLPNGVPTVTIVGQSAIATAPAPLTQTLTITPGTAGKVLAAFNITPTQTGKLDLNGVFDAAFTSADDAIYNVLLYTGTSTGGVAATGGVGCLRGDDANPITVPGGTPVPVSAFATVPAPAGITTRSYSFSGYAEVAVGTAVSVVLLVAGQIAANPWNVGLNGRLKEIPLF